MELIKKIFYSLLFISITCSIRAQNPVEFNLCANGEFKTNDLKSFQIIRYEGLANDDIQVLLTLNISKINDPNIEISVANSELLCIKYELPFWHIKEWWGEGWFYVPMKINIWIKDNRVKIDAPFANWEQICDYRGDDDFNSQTYGALVNKYFKKGKLKEKNINRYSNVMAQLNKVINMVVNINDDTNNNW